MENWPRRLCWPNFNNYGSTILFMELTLKEETASPTVSQDAFFLTSMVDAAEGRHVAITDVKGAYLNAHMKDRVVMKIDGAEVELFVKIDPTLGEYVTVEKGEDDPIRDLGPGTIWMCPVSSIVV